MQKILLSRTDNIGDVILSLPLAAYLKTHYPKIQISFLARTYVKAIVTAYPAIDEFIAWDELDKLSRKEASSQLKSRNFSAVVHIFPRAKIASLCQQANIPQRIGTLSRIFHWWNCNQRIFLSRKNSSLHEAELNFKLLKPFLKTSLPSKKKLIPWCSFKKKKLSKKVSYFLSSEKFNLIIHPGTNGHTKQWPEKNFRELIEKLETKDVQIILTGSQKEANLYKQLTTLPQVRSSMGALNLEELLNLIQHADACLAHSTGPLHIASFAGIKTLGLYPTAPQIGPRRWGPLGHKSTVITEKSYAQQAKDLASIKVATVFEKINKWF